MEFERSIAVKLPIAFNVLMHCYSEAVTKSPDPHSGLVYHYTDSNGLIGIVNSGKFWATNSVFLNDPSDGTYALDIAAEVLRSRRSETKSTHFIDATLQRLSQNRDFDLYVVSLCRNDDLLSQWRAYGDLGRGYALGLEFSKMKLHPQLGRTIEVSYDKDELVQLIYYITYIYVEHLDYTAGRFEEDASNWFCEVINYIAQGFKHPAYSEESEIRLLFSYNQDNSQLDVNHWRYRPILHRAVGCDVVSYIDVAIDWPSQVQQSPLPIKKIVVGPNSSFGRNSRSVASLLDSKNYSKIEIVPSKIPYYSR